MPPKKKQQPTIASFISSDEAESDPEPVPAKKKTAAAKKATAKAAAPKGKRGKAAKQVEEDEVMEDADEVESEEEEEVIVVVEKKGKAAAKKVPAKAKAAPKGRGKKAATPPPEVEEDDEDDSGDEIEEEDESEPTPPPSPTKKPAAKRTTKKKTVTVEIPDTQQSPPKPHSPTTDSDLNGGPTPITKRTSIFPPKSTSRASENPSTTAYSDLESRFQKLQLDYKELTSARLTEPEKALEAFKRNSSARQTAAEKALANLQENIQDQSTLPGEIRALNKAAQKKDAEIAVLKGKLAAMSASLDEVRAENTMLSSKLAARAANPPPAVVPGSAKKPSLGRNGLPMGGVAMGAQDWKAEAKENLYGDLCNLVILNVTKERLQEDGDDELMPYLVYECLQQTRNGTFHFKLKYAESGQDSVTFQPLLDPKRDEKIIASIPEYMTDEIEFQKKSLCSFYEKLTTHARRELKE